MHRFAIVAACACGARQPSAPAHDACEALRTFELPHVAITAARIVPADEYLTADVPAHPPYCRVEAISRPTDDSEIRFEVAIPVGAAWSGRFQQIGNGGFAGMIPEDDILAAVAHGNAAAGTDDGHASTRAIDASWAIGHPERVVDFAYRAVKETHDAALAIIVAYTGHAPRRRYFTGCSDGGREGLIEAQRYPDDFDGIAIAAPANHATQLLAAFGWNSRALADAYLPPAKLPAIERAALAACGGGEVVDDPLACHFDPSVLRCTAAESDDCLTDAQLATLAKLYTGPPGYAGLEPGGEAEPGGWATWVTGSAPGLAGRGLQLRFATTYERYLAGAAIDGASPDLGAFGRHGKLVVFHGWNDPAIPPRDSIAYHDAVGAALGDPSGFYRLFLVPGLLHCEGGRGPSELPMLETVEAWVEQGRAPDRITAKNATRSWELCPYPQRCQASPTAALPSSTRTYGW